MAPIDRVLGRRNGLEVRHQILDHRQMRGGPGQRVDFTHADLVQPWYRQRVGAVGCSIAQVNANALAQGPAASSQRRVDSCG